jgi:hypothetical protein
VPVPIWVDPAAKSYRALGFARGLGASLSAAVLRNAQRAMAAGYRQSRTKGAPMQQGGVLVVMPGGDVVYRYASRVAGDHPPVADVLAALEAAVG